ncbi:MAG: M55 family metallopeptidase, partial [Candidatus Bathyarchaeia archaeon]
MTDMEGVAGVINFSDYAFPQGRYYEIGRQLTTEETNAAIEGLLEAGAREILVVDGHGHGAINQLLLHPSAKLLAGRPLNYPFGIDKSFSAALIIGQHAKSNTDGGHLSHTGSTEVEDLTINGVSLGE